MSGQFFRQVVNKKPVQLHYLNHLCEVKPNVNKPVMKIIIISQENCTCKSMHEPYFSDDTAFLDLSHRLGEYNVINDSQTKKNNTEVVINWNALKIVYQCCGKLFIMRCEN